MSDFSDKNVRNHTNIAHTGPKIPLLSDPEFMGKRGTSDDEKPLIQNVLPDRFDGTTIADNGRRYTS